jgi:hypothetical protein
MRTHSSTHEKNRSFSCCGEHSPEYAEIFEQICSSLPFAFDSFTPNHVGVFFFSEEKSLFAPTGSSLLAIYRYIFLADTL